MRRIIGYTLFWVGIGMVIGFLVPSDAISVLLIFFALDLRLSLLLRQIAIRGKSRGQKKALSCGKAAVPCKATPFFYALSTFPDLKQEVHTYIFLAPPSTLTFTDLMLDFHILFDLL